MVINLFFIKEKIESKIKEWTDDNKEVNIWVGLGNNLILTKKIIISNISVLPSSKFWKKDIKLFIFSGECWK